MNILVFLAASFLIVAAFLRRRRREKYFSRIDALRARYTPIVSGMLEGKIEYGKGLDTLKGITGSDRFRVLELLLIEKKTETSPAPILRQLCADLGLVEVWQQQLIGMVDAKGRQVSRVTSNRIQEKSGRLGYLVRASSAHHLGAIFHQPSWPLLVKALGDAHPDVASVAARSLAAIGEPESFQPLLDCLHDVIQNASRQVSLRSIKMALVSFPLEQAAKLLPSLRHSHRRIRFLAVDIIRGMAERRAAENEDFVLDAQTFAPELSEIFLSRLISDENPDVRARAAPVIAYLPDQRATSALLILLGDGEWFVRMHSARALAKQKYLSCANLIAGRLTDAQWMVREAATRTLLSFGREGLSRLYDHALTTTDRYSKEQIGDEIQRAGLVPVLLGQYAQDRNGKETQVMELLAELGKTSCMLEALEGIPERNLRRKFLADFGRHPDPQIRSWVKGLASGKPFSRLRPRAAVPGIPAPQAGRA
ncbi:MAG TPA: HEAT repeat domain-containing protein [Terriglobia bacterium]|nr:HEAT repeat domain-containing protein [Terriglobia bacterium]